MVVVVAVAAAAAAVVVVDVSSSLVFIFFLVCFVRLGVRVMEFTMLLAVFGFLSP